MQVWKLVQAQVWKLVQAQANLHHYYYLPPQHLLQLRPRLQRHLRPLLSIFLQMRQQHQHWWLPPLLLLPHLPLQLCLLHRPPLRLFLKRLRLLYPQTLYLLCRPQQ